MGAFLKGLRSSAPGPTALWVDWILANMSAAAGNATTTLTLSLSDFPYDVPPALLGNPGNYLIAWPGQPGTAKLVEEAKYTNRAPPVGWQHGNLTSYGAVLRGLRLALAAKGIADRVDFELGK